MAPLKLGDNSGFIELVNAAQTSEAILNWSLHKIHLSTTKETKQLVEVASVHALSATL